MTTKDAKATKELENESLDSIFESRVVEVDQKPDLDPSEFHVGQQLSFVNSLDRFDAFEFDDQSILDQNVNSIAAIELNVFVLHRSWILNLERDSISTEFVRQTLLVCGFQQSRSQESVNLDRTTDHPI